MKIDEKTVVPLSLFGMIGFIIFYAAIVWSKVNEHDLLIKEQKVDMKVIITDLATIKAHMGIKEEIKK